MKAPWHMLLAIALVLGFVAGVVYGLGDRTVLVPPPEATVENFVRKLEPSRCGMAMDHLSDALSRRIGPSELCRLSRALTRQMGLILDVSGELVRMTGDHAQADAVLKLPHGRTARFRLGLHREHGLWRIQDLGDLATLNRS
jgi:hypothetical protein